MIFPNSSAGYAVIVCLTLLVNVCTSLPKEKVFVLGGMFDSGKNDEHLKGVFRHAVERSNIEPWFRPRTRLRWDSISVDQDDNFGASKRLCAMLQNGVHAVVGPLSAKTSWNIQSTCNALQIPHIALHEDFRLRKNESGVSIFPQPLAFAKAIAATISEWEWFHEYAILYETNDALVRVQELLKLQDKVFTLHRLPTNEDYRPLLKLLKKWGIVRFVIDAELNTISLLLEQLKFLNMMTEYYEFVIINLDFHTMNLTTYRRPAANFTGFQIIDPSIENYRDIFSRWRLLADSTGSAMSRDITAPEQSITTQMALIYDAVLLYASAISLVDRGRDVDVRVQTCDMYGKQYKQGLKFISALKTINVTGVTGPLFFDKFGMRSSLNIHVVTNMHDGLLRIATWNAESGLIHLHTHKEYEALTRQHLGQITTLTVTSFLNPPLLMKIENPVEGGPLYEGYVIDLAQKLGEIIGKTLVVRPVLDHAYGSNGTGEWNGMVGELIHKTADLVIADLAITRDRQDAVDFTIPFMNLGIGILHKKDLVKDHNLFSFLDPFSADVWIYVGTSCIGVSVLLFTLARFSPYEWDNPHPCESNPDELENQFNLMNSFWFVIGNLLQQGCDFLPKAMSTRTLASIWAFFIMITVATYTANLAAFLAANQLVTPVTNAADLSKQFKIKYGCVTGGATFNFFKRSQSTVYQTMFRTMEAAEPTVYVEDNTQGINRVLRGDYAFFMESVFIEYQTERNCELTPIGGPLDSKGYGVGLPKGSPYFNVVNNAVLQLQDSSELLILKKKWWQEKTDSLPCPPKPNAMDQLKLGIENVGGVFVLVTMGIVLAVFVGILEFIWFTYKSVREPNVSVWREMMTELKFAMSFGQNAKPIRKSVSEGDNAMAMTGYSSAIFGKDPLLAGT